MRRRKAQERYLIVVIAIIFIIALHNFTAKVINKDNDSYKQQAGYDQQQEYDELENVLNKYEKEAVEVVKEFKAGKINKEQAEEKKSILKDNVNNAINHFNSELK